MYMKIICLDDHPTMLDALTRELTALAPQAQLHAFQDGKAALTFAQKHGCDVLFCEIDLYGSDGLVFAEQMQQFNPRVNLIFTTVCEESEHAKEVLRLHPSGYITKPYTQERLVQELGRLRYPVQELPAEEQPVEKKRPANGRNLRKLSRAELLQMLIAQSRELEMTAEQLKQAQQQLESRRLVAEESGSIALAALQLNGVFDAAQRAADQYLENVRRRAERQTEACARREKESAERAEKLLADTYERCIRLEEYTRGVCEDAVRQAEDEIHRCRSMAGKSAADDSAIQQELRSRLNLYKPMPSA